MPFKCAGVKSGLKDTMTPGAGRSNGSWAKLKEAGKMLVCINADKTQTAMLLKIKVPRLVSVFIDVF